MRQWEKTRRSSPKISKDLEKESAEFLPMGWMRINH
jgi:hypothetical protein